MRAGPIDVDYADGELWAIRWNGHEIVRRIYPVLQDANWHVRPWIIEDEHVDADDEAFRIRVRGRGNHLAPEFTWTAEITGDASGRIAYEWAGSTSAPFWRNRLGLCVLLPIEGLAGKAGVVISPDGTRRDVTFPAAISPHQPFGDAVGIEFDAGAAVRIDFTGDVFEAEDHRNWGDASYKVYCTPIDLPRPVEVCPGDEVRQSVTLTWPVAPARTPDVAGADLIEVARDAVPLPRLGVMAAPEPWTPAEAEDLAALELDHLYVILDLPGHVNALEQAAANARAIEARLRIALRDGSEDDIAALAPRIRDLADLVDVCYAFRSDEPVTSPDWIATVRDLLGPSIPVGGGTDVYFTELNRQPPEMAGLDWLNVPITPQQHGFDDRTVIQNAAALTDIARNLPRIAGDVPVSVSPLSLRRRVNPYAADPSTDVSNDALPANVDARQRTWFAGAWLAIALRNLAIADTVSVVTCFEALGWRGIRERDAGSADPQHFASAPGEPFPAYEVLLGLRGFDRVLPSTSLDPEAYDALVVTDGLRTRAIVANFHASERSVAIVGAATGHAQLPPTSLSIIDLQGAS